MTFEELLKKLKKINLDKMEAEILKELEPEIIDLNISQMAKGEGKSGSKFPTYANIDYYKAKSSEGLTEQAGKHYNLLLTGDFRKEMYLKQSGNNSEIDSKDSKTAKLRKLTDNDMFGLQKKSLKELEEDYLYDEFSYRLDKALE